MQPVFHQNDRSSLKTQLKIILKNINPESPPQKQRARF